MISNAKKSIINSINAKRSEAESYTDPSCYNAAYCYGYAAGATEAMTKLESESPIWVYSVIKHYSNENQSIFDSVSVFSTFVSKEAAIESAKAHFTADKLTEPDPDVALAPVTVDDCKDIINPPIFCVGEKCDANSEVYHNFYAVIATVLED